MEYYTFILIFLFVILSTIYLSKLFSKSKQLPPGPKPWPIIGNFHELGDKPHRTVAELAKKYGPIMSLKLGCKTIIVISSPEIAKEMFLNHDLALSSRDIVHTAGALNHDKFSIIWLPVGPKWRDLRKITAAQLFTTQRLDASQTLRQKKVNELLDYVRQCAKSGTCVDIGKAGFTTSLNLLSNTFFSMDLASHASSYSQEFKELVTWLQTNGQPNFSDFFPLIKHLDLQGVFKRTKDKLSKVMLVFDEIIDGRLKDPTNNVKDDVLDILLKNVHNDQLSLDDVRHLLADMFIAGADTSSITLEWAMTELLRNPEIIKKAQFELDKVLGKDGSIQESDMSKLHYIQAILKETLRLHPPGPFLVPRKAEKDVQLCNYLVPKNSSIWVNVWSLGRDPTIWRNPEIFYPERFLEENIIDFKGRDFELLPFGSGRRICPGLSLGHRMTYLMLASLLNSFNWKYGHNNETISPTLPDIDDKFGLALHKVVPLQAIPILR